MCVAIPDLGSLILTHNPNGVVHGLKDWPPTSGRRRSIVPFFGFRIMVGIAVDHARSGRGEPMAALAGRAFRRPLVPVVLHAGLAPRLRGRAGRLGDDRSRAPAMDSLWAPAHGRFRVSVSDRLRRRGLVRRLLPCLPRHVLRGPRADDQNRPSSVLPRRRSSPSRSKADGRRSRSRRSHRQKRGGDHDAARS